MARSQPTVTLRSLLAHLCVLGLVSGLSPTIAHAQGFAAPSQARADAPGAALGGDLEPPAYPNAGHAPPGGDSPASENGSSVVTPPPGSQIDMGLIRRVRVGGELLSATPLRVGNVDVLAPAVAQLPKVGATVTQVSPENVPGGVNSPTEDQYFQINVMTGPPIVMVIGRAIAYIKGASQLLPAAPMLIEGKIWLPLYSLAPLLGAATRLESDGTLNLNPTIQSVQLYPFRNTIALTVKASAPLPQGKVLMGTLDSPPKLYLDFPGFSMGFDAAGSTDQRTVAQGVGNVTGVRAGLFQKFPDTTRLVLDLKKATSGVAQPMPDSTMFTLVLVPPGGSIPTPSTGGTPPPPIPTAGHPLNGWTIVIDAGHGGHDTGARGAHSDEKNHTLDITRRLRDRLRDLGANTLMTRDGDYFVTLQGRVNFANTRNADLFVSVHNNASVNHSSSGTETFFYTGQSVLLAREVHKELSRATGLPNRGVSQARFYVVRKTTMPSILTESAFITNPREEKLLMSPAFRQKLANGIAQGIVNYALRYGRH